MLHRRSSLAPLLAVALAFPIAGLARAEDKPAAPAATDADEVKKLVLEIETAQKAKDEAALTALVKKVPPLYKDTEDAASKAALLKSLGALVKNAKMGSARMAALSAISETEDGKEAWKVIQGSYPADDVEDPEHFNVEFVRIVGLLHPDAAIEKLLETFRKSKLNDLAGEAATALGNYHKSKQREHIFEELVKAGKGMVPANTKTQSASAETTARWAALGPKLGAALDALTGDRLQDPQKWFTKYNESKKSLKTLFKD